jgi:hypothetical protein
MDKAPLWVRVTKILAGENNVLFNNLGTWPGMLVLAH